jgi:CheY-like chemotaxis protein
MARVLLAESDRRLRRMIAGILTDLGHEVRECADCAEANALLPVLPVDVLVSDLVLRDGDGASLARASLSGGVPAVTLSGSRVEADMPGAAPALSLLERPFRFADLQQVAATVAACVGASARRAA